MITAKKEVQKMLDQIPDDASFEDIQHHIYVRQKIESGLKDVEEGRVLSQEEVERGGCPNCSEGRVDRLSLRTE